MAEKHGMNIRLKSIVHKIWCTVVFLMDEMLGVFM